MEKNDVEGRNESAFYSGKTITNLQRPISTTINRQRARIIATKRILENNVLFLRLRHPFSPSPPPSPSPLSFSPYSLDQNQTLLHLCSNDQILHQFTIRSSSFEIYFLSHVYIYILYIIYTQFPISLFPKLYSSHTLEINRGKKKKDENEQRERERSFDSIYV